MPNRNPSQVAEGYERSQSSNAKPKRNADVYLVIRRIVKTAQEMSADDLEYLRAKLAEIAAGKE